MAVSCAVALVVVAAASDTPYAWPLDLPQVITSSFAEYRAGRFHAGIDLRTGGVGQPVHAPADARISRLSCSPWGYGKALYLELADGNTVVFGHLNDFAPALSDYVRKAQHAKAAYAVNLTPGPGDFPVKRGQVVAFSGDTGVGAAHLHYEIRDRQGYPINPRRLGITWPDKTWPVVRKLLVVPTAPESTVNGDILPVVMDVRATEPGRYVCDPVRATGRIGFGLDVFDPANEGTSKLGIYKLRTVVGDTEIFKIQMDRFSYAHRDNEIVSYYPFPLDKGCFLLQWRWPGNVCDIFQQTKSDGWYAVPNEPVKVRLETEDFQGNQAVLTVPVKPDAAAAVAQPAKGGSGKGRVAVSFVGTWLVVMAKFSAAEPVTPALSVEGATPDSRVFRRVNDTTFRAAVIPAAQARELILRATHDRMAPFEQRLHVFHRGDPDRTITVDGFSVTVKTNSPYGTLFLRAFDARETSPPPLPMRGAGLRLWPAIMPIDDPIEISLPMPGNIAAGPRLGVYRDTGSSWAFEIPPDARGRFTCSTRRLGVFAILDDDKPPVITNVRVETAPGGRPSIRATVSDVGSGIARADITCNGRWLLTAYDPEHDLIYWERDEDLPAGPNELTFTASDKAGNTTTVTRKLEPVSPAKARPAELAKPKPAQFLTPKKRVLRK